MLPNYAGSNGDACRTAVRIVVDNRVENIADRSINSVVRAIDHD